MPSGQEARLHCQAKLDVKSSSEQLLAAVPWNHQFAIISSPHCFLPIRTDARGTRASHLRMRRFSACRAFIGRSDSSKEHQPTDLARRFLHAMQARSFPITFEPRVPVH